VEPTHFSPRRGSEIASILKKRICPGPGVTQLADVLLHRVRECLVRRLSIHSSDWNIAIEDTGSG